MPIALAAAAIGPACAGKDDTTMHASEVATETDTAGMTGMTGTTGTTSEPTGGELPDCRMYDDDIDTCSGLLECLYLSGQKACIVRCDNFAEEAACAAQEYCYWDSGGCYLAV